MAEPLERSHLLLPYFTSSLGSFVSVCVCKLRIETLLYRMSYSAVLFTVRSSSVCQDVGSANSMVICMFPRYILDWLSNLKPLSRTGKSCNGTCGRKSICFIVKKFGAQRPFALTVGFLCDLCALCLARTSASGWPRWCCTCSDETCSPPEHFSVQTRHPPECQVHRSLANES